MRPPTRALCVAAATPAPQTACALLPASCRVGGFALGRWGGSHATAAGEDVGVALRRGLARTPCVAAATPAPPLRLCVAACKLGGGGVALGRSGGSTATWARCRPWNAGLQAVAAAPPPQLPRLHLGVAACKLGGGGVAFNLLSIYYTYLMVGYN